MAMLNNQRVHHGVNINPLQQSMEHLPFRSMMFRKKNSSLQFSDFPGRHIWLRVKNRFFMVFLCFDDVWPLNSAP